MQASPSTYYRSLTLRVTGGWEAGTIDGGGDNGDKTLRKWPVHHMEAGDLMPVVRAGSGATRVDWKSRTPKTQQAD